MEKVLFMTIMGGVGNVILPFFEKNRSVFLQDSTSDMLMKWKFPGLYYACWLYLICLCI